MIRLRFVRSVDATHEGVLRVSVDRIHLNVDQKFKCRSLYVSKFYRYRYENVHGASAGQSLKAMGSTTFFKTLGRNLLVDGIP